MQANFNDFKTWTKLHREELFAAGFTVAVAFGIFLGIKNKDSFAKLWEPLERTIKVSPPEAVQNAGHTIATNIEPATSEALVPITEKVTKISLEQVSSHIRRLPQGQKASPAKIMAAQEMGIALNDGYTFVTSYPRERQIAA